MTVGSGMHREVGGQILKFVSSDIEDVGNELQAARKRRLE
jgi:hypothetical protein